MDSMIPNSVFSTSDPAIAPAAKTLRSELCWACDSSMSSELMLTSTLAGPGFRFEGLSVGCQLFKQAPVSLSSFKVWRVFSIFCLQEFQSHWICFSCRHFSCNSWIFDCRSEDNNMPDVLQISAISFSRFFVQSNDSFHWRFPEVSPSINMSYCKSWSACLVSFACFQALCCALWCSHLVGPF